MDKVWIAVFDDNTNVLLACGWADNATVSRGKLYVNYGGSATTVPYLLSGNGVSLIVQARHSLVNQYKQAYATKGAPLTEATLYDYNGDETVVSVRTAEFFRRMGMLQSYLSPTESNAYVVTVKGLVQDISDIITEALDMQ